MCVVSMVYDNFDKKFPFTETSPWPSFPITPVKTDPKPEQDWIKLLKDFADAKKAAETVDKLTGQPDCVDPEKAKLEERVKELEEIIKSGAEFVIVKRQNMQPGRYRLIAGKIYRVLE